MGGPRRHHRHHLPRSDLVPLRDQRAHRLVRGPQRRFARPRELDRQHPPSRDPARERDPAGGGREHLRTRCGGEVRPAVPRSVVRGGRLPSPHDHGPAGQRPDACAVRRRSGRGGRGHRIGGGRGHGCGRPVRRGGRRPAPPPRHENRRRENRHHENCRRENGSCGHRRHRPHRTHRPHRSPRRSAPSAAACGPDPGSVLVRCDSHGTTVPRRPGPRGSWTGSVEYRPVVDSAVTRHSTGPVHFFWRSGSPGRLRTPRHLPLNGGGRAPRSLVARRVGASGATANLRSR